MSFLAWMFAGLVAGVVFRGLLLRGDAGGFVVPILLGIAGGLFGGSVGRLAELYHDGDPRGWAAALIGAVALLALYRLVMRGRAG